MIKSPYTTPTALLLIDVQRGFDHATHWGGPRNNPAFEKNVTSILGSFRQLKLQTPDAPVHVVHIHHHSTQPGSMLHPSATISVAGEIHLAVDPQPFAKPLAGEAVFIKSVNSCFIGTRLEEYLRKNAIKQLVIVGLTTDHCVSTTTRMAANLKVLGDDGGIDGSGEGHGILLIEDAVATFGKGEFEADVLHRAHLTSLNDEFCHVVKTEEILSVMVNAA